MAGRTDRARGIPEAAEVTSFRLKPGIPATKALEAGRDIDAWLRRQPGFVSRLLMELPNGVIQDIVVWRTERDGRVSSGKLMSETAASPFHDLVDVASVDWGFAAVLA